MKTKGILILSLVAAVMLPQIAKAKLSIPPEALGAFEARLDSCAKVDPSSAADYKKRGSGLVGDATKEELDKARSSSEYKASYDSATKEMEETPKSEAVKACRAFLEGK